jgi:tetratricopeptide (TPR) repeat protein
MKKNIIAFCVFLNAQFAFACLNHFDVFASKPLLDNAGYVVFSRNFSFSVADSALVQRFQLDSMAIYPYEKLTNIGVLLTKFGRLDEALVIFKKLYQEHPNDYKAVANLGTIYELVGQLNEAKALIEKALILNPNSHDGSEWFHVKVLTAKLALQADSNWLMTHKVMNLGRDKQSPRKSSEYNKSMALIRQIAHQLQERLPFTPTPNLLIANVLNELGDLCALEYSIKEAYSAYLIALAYDPDDVYKIQEKMKKIETQLTAYDTDLPLIKRVFHGDSTIVYHKIAAPIVKPQEHNWFADNKKTIGFALFCLLSLGILRHIFKPEA